MNTKIGAAVLVLSMSLGTSAYADGGHGNSHRGEHRSHSERHGGGHQDSHRDRNREHRSGYAWNDGRAVHRDWDRHHYREREVQHWNHDYRAYEVHPQRRFHVARYYRPHGYSVRVWHHGDYLPRAYYAPRYVVDYRPYHLRMPPHGYHWVRVDHDVLLTAIATGLVVGAVYDVFY
ncbi:MAG TPA: RcnB family protein [Steroidobacteraceae bacterium]|jgi:Ni/Co efflux regulator RcnB|nr:RcnB family protein [Steroidobacteraceae bacterium]